MPVSPVAAACALEPGLRGYLTPAALAALRAEQCAILPTVWALLDAHGRVGLAPTDHTVGTQRMRVVAGADGAVVLGVIGIDFAGADRTETAPARSRER
jgi:hypothetical protein